MLFDTDVLTWYFRGNLKVAKVIDRAETRAISIVTYMELLQGARDKREQKAIRTCLVDLGFETLGLAPAVGHRAAIYMEEYALRVALCAMDALIAATAVELAMPLCTGNRKHFAPITELEIQTFRP